MSHPTPLREPEPTAFLFTDIEGSTRLWEAQPRAMGLALARHDAILRGAIETSGGRVFKTVGDAFCAAFADPLQATLAAIDAQRALASEAWTGVPGIVVRMAIHAGVAEERDGDYFGPPLNRVSRLLSLASGGQVLMSGPAADAMRARLPADAALLDLGHHHLKDLQDREHIWQLVAPGLRESFPVLRGAGAFRHTVPEPPTPLIGREAEIAAAAEALGVANPGANGARLLTLTGPGGAGKTRLSIALAAELGSRWADGPAFVSLAHITDPALAPLEIAARLGLTETGGNGLDALVAFLRPLSLLLVLDNLEQVMDAADVVAELLATCPRLAIVVTSRERLRLRGERELPVPPLALPSPAGGMTGRPLDGEMLAAAEASPAVRLFAERARAARPGFALDEDSLPAVVQLCRALDGLPLAIELVAARTRLLSPRALLDRFDRRLDLLSGGARDLPPRHRAMRDTIAWSVTLLDPDERRTFARLAVFAAGATLDAAEAVASRGAEQPGSRDERTATEAFVPALDSISSLADKSLVRIEDGADGEPRLAMLETIRAYATEVLAASGEAEDAADAHAAWFLGLAETAAPLIDGPEQRAWLDRLETEHPNLRSALARLADADDPTPALRLAAALWRFWWLRGHAAEGRGSLERLLALPATPSGPIRVAALNGAGTLAEAMGDRPAAAVLHEQALAEARRGGDSRGIARSLDNLGVLAIDAGDFERARSLLQEAVQVANAAGDAAGLATALNDLGQTAYWLGDHEGAVACMERSLAEFRRLGDESHTARVLNNLGKIAHDGGDPARAQPLFADALRRHRTVGDRPGIASTLNNLAEVARATGEPESAFALYSESHAIALETNSRPIAAVARENYASLAREQGRLRDAAEAYRDALRMYLWMEDAEGIAACLSGLAAVALAEGDAPQAARLLGASAGIPEIDPTRLPEDRTAAETFGAICATLGPERAAAEWRTGAATPVERFAAEPLPGILAGLLGR